jgi:hypothetical protein
MKIKKVTPDKSLRACVPNIGCIPNTTVCNPIRECIPDLVECIPNTICLPIRECIPVSGCIPNTIVPILQDVSGTYESPRLLGFGPKYDLRIDVDGRRSQNLVSGDKFVRGINGLSIQTQYQISFVVESLDITDSENEMVISGSIRYYHDDSLLNDTIEIRIPRVSIFDTPDATVKFYRAGRLQSTHLCSKTSELFRTVNLEIDRLQGTTFPPSANTHTDPHPAALPEEDLTCAEIFRRAGIDMTVVEDDVFKCFRWSRYR